MQTKFNICLCSVSAREKEWRRRRIADKIYNVGFPVTKSQERACCQRSIVLFLPPDSSALLDVSTRRSSDRRRYLRSAVSVAAIASDGASLVTFIGGGSQRKICFGDNFLVKDHRI